MKGRYRILTSTTDEAEVLRVYEQNEEDSRLATSDFFGKLRSSHRWQQSDQGPLGPAVAFAEAPRKVLASDGEAELEEVKQMLLEGRMSSTDLVDIGQGWQTVIECYPFEEEALIAAKRDERRLTARSLLLMVAAFAGIALVVAFIYLTSE